VNSAGYTGSALLLGACVLAALTGGHWSWPLFAWGALLGPLAAYCSYLASGIAYATLKQATGAPDELYQAMMARREARFVPMLVSFIVDGLAAGIASAGLRTAWPDVLATVVLFGFAVLLPLVGARFVAKRVRPTQFP
jgi:hypothetical protein